VRSVGAAVAIGYRREVVQTWGDDGGIFATDATPLDVVGLRTHGLLRVTDKNNIGLRVGVFGGLTTNTRDAVVTVSFTAGGFLERMTPCAVRTDPAPCCTTRMREGNE